MKLPLPPTGKSSAWHFDNEDLWCAAEAVVDAASWSRIAHGIAPWSDEEKAELVAAVYQEPILTSQLFCFAPRILPRC